MDDTMQVKKYMFDLSFDGATGVAQRAPERKPVLLKPEQIDQLKKESFDLGFAEGVTSGTEAQTERQTAAINHLEQQLTRLLHAIQSIEVKQESAARAIAMAAFERLMPSFVAKNGKDEIISLIDSAIKEMGHEPRLVIYTNLDDLEFLKTKIDAIATQKAYVGKVQLLADSNLSPGDCRIEWSDGGLERNTKDMAAAINTLITGGSNG